MTKIIHAERAGKFGKLRVGCCAVIFDDTRERVLLVQRRDNELWCLPGGAMEAGESVVEACSREVFEETGLRVRVGRLISVFSNPHRRVEYPDGERVHVVALTFEAERLDGELQLSGETQAFGYFSLDEIRALPLLDSHLERIEDAFAHRAEAFVR
ncbi:NUDIX domain-containing protein [candidate division KSB1 bacterium]|nr:NUDIX domain-containing protein [candidate division KSB1 bacterium]